MQIQWYPGHMTKAKRAMQEDIKLVDLVLEILDARAVLSSRNPDIDSLAANKYRLIILNKADLADRDATNAWIRYFKEKGITAVSLDARSHSGIKDIQNRILEVCREKIEKDRKKGILNRPIRAMVAGIPNVGKSTFINSFAGRSAAKTGNKPGVTKGKQWIRLNKQVELLDTPGILWPKFEDQTVGLHLALLGSISDDVIDAQELAYEYVKAMDPANADQFTSRYQVEIKDDPNETIADAALARKALKKGGEPDTLKASQLIIDDLRTGRLGSISLERP